MMDANFPVKRSCSFPGNLPISVNWSCKFCVNLGRGPLAGEFLKLSNISIFSQFSSDTELWTWVISSHLESTLTKSNKQVFQNLFLTTTQNLTFWSRKVFQGFQITCRNCFEKTFLIHFVLSSKIMIKCQKAILVHFQNIRKCTFGPFEQLKLDQKYIRTKSIKGL